MKPLRIFISSVQKEFAEERARVAGLPARRCAAAAILRARSSSRRCRLPTVGPTSVYLDEVDRCDLYVGLFGNDYGVRGCRRAFRRPSASSTWRPQLRKHRLIFVKGRRRPAKHPKMQALIRQAGRR